MGAGADTKVALNCSSPISCTLSKSSGNTGNIWPNELLFWSYTVCAPPLEEVYKFNWWPKDLTVDELDISDPYNTRKVVGLPPAPISNPSVSAINAVINSVPSDYYYYINDSYGNTHFAKTLEEHNLNITKYLNN